MSEKVGKNDRACVLNNLSCEKQNSRKGFYQHPISFRSLIVLSRVYDIKRMYMSRLYANGNFLRNIP